MTVFKKALTLSSVLLAVSLLTACPTPTDPYTYARTMVKWGRTTTSMANTGFLTAKQQQVHTCNSNICIKKDPTKGKVYNECMKEDHTTEPVFISCFSTMAKAWAIWEKSYPLADSIWDTTDTSIDLAEAIHNAKASGDSKALGVLCLKLDPTKGANYVKCMAGQDVGKADYEAVLKAGACTVAHALGFIPDAYMKYVGALIAILKGYGCK